MKPLRPVLLIDGNSDDVERTRYALEHHGVSAELVVALDCAAALRWLFEERARGGAQLLDPQVVLLEPRVAGGWQVLCRVREHARTRYLPVVILTSSRDRRDVEESYRLGANSYVQKPVDRAEFVAVAREIVRYWVVLNERIPSGASAP